MVTTRAKDLPNLLEQLRQVGQEADRTLLDRLKALGQPAVQPLIAMATDERLHRADGDSPLVWAPLHAIQLLGELETEEAVQPLLTLMDQDDDWLEHYLPIALGRIGQAALAPLRDELFAPTTNTGRPSRAAAALAEAAKHHPELRSPVIASLTQRLDAEWSRGPADETINGFVISELLNLKAVEAIPAIRRAYQQDRVNEIIVGLEHVERELGLEPSTARPATPPAGLRLDLRCTACGYSRRHDVPKIYYDLGTADRQRRGESTRYDPFIIPQRITCPKCGAVDQYELGSMAHLVLTAELLKHAALKDKDRKAEFDDPSEVLQIIRLGLKDGRELHPYEARDEYRERIAAEPKRADLRVGYANILRFLDERTEAIAQYRAAIKLDSANLEALLNLANLLRLEGRQEEARLRFEEILRREPTSTLPRDDRDEYRDFARAALDELAGKPSARPLELTAKPRPALTTPVGRAPAPSQKIGRNAPCPCGRGLKYKRCCGR